VRRILIALILIPNMIPNIGPKYFTIENLMRHSRFRAINCLLALLLSSLVIPRDALAGENSQWLLQTAIYTTHFNPTPEHVNNQRLLNLEYRRPDQWLVGAAVFDNSYGQPSQYLYLGKLWRPFEPAPLVHVKLTGGLLHGYKDEYRDKIPFNSSGIAPAILPAIGLSGKHISGEVIVFGTAGAMLTFGVLW
jgi:hypothetical protein